MNSTSRMIVIVLTLVFLSGCTAGSSRLSRRFTEGLIVGGVTGAAVGGAAGGGKGAVVGAGVGSVLGGLAGVAAGVKEEEIVRHEPVPLTWMWGKRVAVECRRGGYRRGAICAVIEDELRDRGAEVVAPVNRRRYYNRIEDVSAAYRANVNSERRGKLTVLTIRIVRESDNVMMAQSQGTYWRNNGRGDEYYAAEAAAARAVRTLH